MLYYRYNKERHMNNGYQNEKRVRNEEHALLAATTPARPATGRRGKHTPQQKYEQLCKLMDQGKVQRWTSYLNKHRADLLPILNAAQVEVYPNTPADKAEALDPRLKYEAEMEAWRERCTHLHRVRKKSDKLLAAGRWTEFGRYAKKHLRDLLAEDPVQPVEPEEARIPPPPDKALGMETLAKSKSITAIQKEMAEEQRKARAAKVEPAPDPSTNPWLHAKHARNK